MTSGQVARESRPLQQSGNRAILAREQHDEPGEEAGRKIALIRVVPRQAEIQPCQHRKLKQNSQPARHPPVAAAPVPFIRQRTTKETGDAPETTAANPFGAEPHARGTSQQNQRKNRLAPARSRKQDQAENQINVELDADAPGRAVEGKEIRIL